MSFHWNRVLLAGDQHQQYGFPVSASQRASVTLTPLHSAPSDSTPRSESYLAECLISQPDRSFFSPPSSAFCPLVAIARSMDAWMNFFKNVVVQPIIQTYLFVLHPAHTSKPNFPPSLFCYICSIPPLNGLNYFHFSFDIILTVFLLYFAALFQLFLSLSLLLSPWNRGKGPAVCSQKPGNSENCSVTSDCDCQELFVHKCNPRQRKKKRKKKRKHRIVSTRRGADHNSQSCSWRQTMTLLKSVKKDLAALAVNEFLKYF